MQKADDMLSLNELEIFVLAAENGSFSEAARLLHLSQPAISQTIQNLEKRFGVELFSRKGRSVKLTDAGEALLPMARELLTTANRLEESMTALQGVVAGKVEIGCSTASGKYLLPNLISHFRGRYPRVRIDVHVNSRENVIERLIEGRIHFAIVSKQIDHSALEYAEFYRDEVILIAPASHPWARNCHIFPDDLLDAPMITRESGSGTYEVVLRGLAEHDITPDMLNVVMSLGNAEAIEMSVEEGIGVAFVSRLAAARGLALGRVVEVKVENLHLTQTLYISRNTRFPGARSQNEFWDFVRQASLTTER